MFNRIGILTLAALLGAGVVLTPGAAGQTIWYVDDDAPNDPGPGDPGVSDPDEDGSPEHPFDAIQEAIYAAADGEEVLVADGTYTGYGNRDLDFWGKAITVRSENGADTCIIDCEAGPDDWHWGFWFHNSETAAAIVDGLTITNAYCDPGGGIFCGGGASPTITNCIIAGNEALWYGGGIQCGGTTAIVGCSFLGNTAHWGGGGYFGAEASVSACTFTGNTAQGAGALICSDDVTIRGCVISENIAYEGTGGLSCADSATISDCVITGNWADSDHTGGGVSCSGDGLTISRCLIADNWAFEGAGIYCYGGNPTIVDCVFAVNGAEWGSGITVRGSAPVVANCLFIGDASFFSGTAIAISRGNPIVENCTITHFRRGVYCYDGSPAITNSVLWRNTLQAILVGVDGAPVVSYSDVEGGWEGTGNIDVDPLFVDADGPDDDPNTWEDNDYRLLSDSPCIDAGDNDAVPAWVTTDLDGRLRFADRIGTLDTGSPGAPGPPIVDMGPYEYQCTGDLNADGEIDLSDLGALLAHYGTTTGAAYADGDLDQDGDVDLTDLATLLAAYATTCE